MATLKHIGRVVKNQRKVIVAYRLVPGTDDKAVVIPTENLMAEEHDTVMRLLESPQGQDAYEFAELMARNVLPDGRNILSGFHTTGRMQQVETKDIEMTPDSKTVINLAELNKIIADQKGVAIEDLALKGPEEETTETVTETVPSGEPVEAPNEGVLSDEDLAKQYRSQADAMFKEAQKLRKQAEELSPTKAKKAEASAKA